MENKFAFLGKARPASLARLLQKLPPEDAAIALSGMPPAMRTHVAAFFPEDLQEKLASAMFEARRAEPSRADETVGRIRELLVEAKKEALASPDSGGSASVRPDPPASPPSPPAQRRETDPYRPASGQPRRPAAQTAPVSLVDPAGQMKLIGAPYSVNPAPGVSRRPGVPDKPTPWIPRQATASPINGPALPGRPTVSGDPFKSPLAKAGLLDLIGRAQEKYLPKRDGRRGGAGPEAGKHPVRAKQPPGRPAAREGVVPLRAVGVDRTPRVVGGPATAPEKSAEGARNIDGKAILAAILRASDDAVRAQVRRDDPGLYRELRGRMFYFDDLVYTEDAALAKVFTAAPAGEAALALKFAAPVLRDRVLRAVSPGRASVLRDAPPLRGGFDAVELAQKKVLNVALQLQAAGRILIDPRDPDLVK